MKNPLTDAGPIGQNLHAALDNEKVTDEGRDIIVEMVHRAYWKGHQAASKKAFEHVMEIQLNELNWAADWPIKWGKWEPESSILNAYGDDPAVIQPQPKK